MQVKVHSFVKKMFPRRMWNASREGKKLYLSFDDGPIPEVTPWVLEQLQKYNAKATFFCIGENISKNPEIFRELIINGHSVGNHTYNHLNGWQTPFQQYLDNTLKAQALMEKYLPAEHEKADLLFRPPYGKITNRQSRELQKRHFKIVMWEVLSVDYDPNISPEKCLKNVLKNAGPGSIVVFHDSLKAERNLKYALPRVLEHFSGKGYVFEKL